MVHRVPYGEMEGSALRSYEFQSKGLVVDSSNDIDHLREFKFARHHDPINFEIRVKACRSFVHIFFFDLKKNRNFVCFFLVAQFQIFGYIYGILSECLCLV